MRKLAATFFAAFVALLLTAQQTPEQFNFYVNTLPAATTAFSADQFYVRQAGLSKQMTYGVLTAGLTSFSGALTVGDCASWSTTTGRLQDSGGPCQATPGGLSGQVQVNLNNAFAGINNTSLTALINPCTASLSGAAPAGGGNANAFLNGNCVFTTPSGGGNVSTSGTIVTGNCAQWNGPTTLISTTAPCGSGGGGGGGGTNLGWINIQSFGTTGVAMGDGTCHQLSASYANLAAAQVVYPFVSDLTQCIDWAAAQQAFNVAFSSAPLVNGSFDAYCPTGNYQISNPLWFDQANNSQGTDPAWAVGTTYGNAARVKYNGIPWISMGSGNVGAPPTSMNLFPAQLNIVNSGGGSIYPAGYPWATVQISNASPAVITPLLAGGTLAVTANMPIVFFTQQVANPNGGAAPALPTGISANTVYYVRATGLTGTTFQISATPGGAAINTSSAGVGNFFVSGQVWQVAALANAPLFSSQVNLIGAEGVAGNSGCTFTTQNNFTSPAIVIGPQNGNKIKSITVQGQVQGNPGNNGYKCTAPFSNQNNAGAQLGAAGFAVVSSGGGSHNTVFEGTGAFGFFIGDWRGYTTTGTLTDSNTWIKPGYSSNCINVYMANTQAFINTIYDGTITNSTTNIFASTQEGVKIVGGNYSQFFGLATSFAISGVSTSGSCGNNFVICVIATITSPDNNLQLPMCSYSAGSAYAQQVKWLNSWPFAAGCGYNTWVFKTSQWGLVGAYVMNYNPFSQQITLGVPQAYAGIYQGTCCGANFATQLAAQTTVYAAEAATSFYGNNQVDSVHIENIGVPTTLSAFATQFFGGARTVELKNVFVDSEISLGSLICCNRGLASNFLAQGYVQQAIPWINCTIGDCVIDGVTGGFNAASAPTSNFAGDFDRALIATETSTYVEGRHSMGTNNQNISTGSGGNNAAGPFLDFANSAIGNTFLSTSPLVNPGTLGQLSGGYYAMGGSAYGSGLWDNPSHFVSGAAYSVNASNQPINMADLWRAKGWGQTPYWGIRPATWASPCILPSQGTSLAALPAITHVSNLQDYLLPNAGGTGYAVNDTITLAGGTFTTAAQVFVTGVSSGAVTSVQVSNKGAYTVEPTAFTQGSTTGGGTGATFQLPIWYVNYTIPYPLLWGGHLYHACNFNNADFGAHGGLTNALAIKSTHLGWTYGQNLTTTNVPNLAWTMDGASPFINMNLEALELMFPGLVIGLVSDGTGGCTVVAQQNFMVLETHPAAGYVKVVRTDTDGGPYVPSLAASGTVCKNNVINQAAFSLVYPY